MNKVVPVEIKPEKREEALRILSHVNMRQLCKEVGIQHQYVIRVLDGTARMSHNYPLALEVIKKAKEQYEQKIQAIEYINSL